MCILQWFKIFGWVAAYELQTNRTWYPTVFNSDTAQYVEFDLRRQIITFALAGSSPALVAPNFSRAKWRGWVQNQQTVKIYLIMGVSWNETARPFQSISSPWTWIALPWANGSRTLGSRQTRGWTVAIKINHRKHWVKAQGQQYCKWVEPITMKQRFTNALVPCPINDLRKTSAQRVRPIHDQAPRLASNF